MSEDRGDSVPAQGMRGGDSGEVGRGRRGLCSCEDGRLAWWGKVHWVLSGKKKRKKGIRGRGGHFKIDIVPFIHFLHSNLCSSLFYQFGQKIDK